MANEEQARYWGDQGGRRWVAGEADFDLMLEPFGRAVVDALAPRAGEHVLDVGCGFGTTTAAVARAVGPTGRVVGIDLSGPMIERARDRLAKAAGDGLAPVELVVGDAQTGDLRGPHDAVVSRFGIMFFADTAAAIAHISAAVRPGGRIAFVCWRDMSENPWYALPNSVIVAALPSPPPLPSPLTPSPFGFGNIGAVTELMSEDGWVDIEDRRFDADVPLGGVRGLDGALEHAQSSLAGRLLFEQLPAERAEHVMQDVRAVLAHYEDDGVVRLPAAAWIVTARRP